MLLVWGLGQRCHCIISCWHLLMGPLFLRLKATLFRFQRSVGDVLIGAAMDCRCEGSHRTEGQYFYGSNVCSTSLVRLDTACLFGRLLSASWRSTPIKDFQKLKLSFATAELEHPVVQRDGSFHTSVADFSRCVLQWHRAQEYWVSYVEDS